MSRRRWKPPRCSTGKAAFRTQGAALNALRHIQIDHAQAAAPTDTMPQSAYRCRCGAWHLTQGRS